MSRQTIDMYVREIEGLANESERARKRAQAFRDHLLEDMNHDMIGAELLKTMIDLARKGDISYNQIRLDTSAEDGTILVTYVIKPKEQDANKDAPKEVA